VNGLWHKAWRDILLRRTRSAFTILGIAVGVAALVAVVAAARTLIEAQAAAFAGTSQADIVIGVVDAPPGAEQALGRLPGVEATELRMAYYTKWATNPNGVRGGPMPGGESGQTSLWHDLYFIGVEDFTDMRVNRLELIEGHYPHLDEVLLELSVPQIIPVAVGQMIAVRSQPEGAIHYLRVSGFARSPTYLSAPLINVAIAYAPAATLRHLSDAEGDNQLLVRVKDPARADEVARQLTRALDLRGIPHNEPDVRDRLAFPGRRELETLEVVLLLFSGLALVVSGFLVANTLAALVTEGTREIGILKAVGATRWQVLGLYLLITGVYGLTGTVVGLASGSAIAWLLAGYVGHLANVTVPLRPAGVALALGAVVGLGVPFAAGLPAAWSAAGLTVRQALTAYGLLSAYGRRPMDRLWQRLTGLPPLIAMAWRNLTRRPTRNGVTMLVVVLATAALVAARSTELSVRRAVDDIFNTYAADAWVFLSQSVGPEFARSLEGLPGVTTVEPWSLNDCWVGSAPARLWGLPAATTLYRPRLQEGRWYLPGEHDAVAVSSDLAAAQHISLGETIEVDLGHNNKRSFRVVGIVVDNAIFLGSATTAKVFIPVDTVGRLLNRLEQANLFAIGTTDHAPQRVDAVLANLEAKYRRLGPISDAAHREFASGLEQTRILTLGLGIMVVLVGVGSGLGVVNTLTLSVAERRREIGVLRALGAGDLHLILAFLAEGVALGGIGGVLGLAAGYIAGVFFVARMERLLFQMPFVFPADLIPYGLVFAIVLAALASLGPAWAASRLPAGETLRYE
jgi:putative ABC transport system permease protein